MGVAASLACTSERRHAGDGRVQQTREEGRRQVCEEYEVKSESSKSSQRALVSAADARGQGGGRIEGGVGSSSTVRIRKRGSCKRT